jgi:hypothetical protein
MTVKTTVSNDVNENNSLKVHYFIDVHTCLGSVA